MDFIRYKLVLLVLSSYFQFNTLLFFSDAINCFDLSLTSILILIFIISYIS